MQAGKNIVFKLAMNPTSASTWFDRIWLLALIAASSVWCLTASARLGVTFDESFYVPAGLAGWRDGTNERLTFWGTMPLPANVQTLPLYLWERATGRVWPDDILVTLPFARAGNLPFWWLLLAYAMRFGKRLGGAWAGRIAAGFVATDPTFLGHAALATTDIAVTALTVAFAYHWEAGRERKFAWRILWPGVLFGLAVNAKASALLYCGLALFVCEAWRWKAIHRSLIAITSVVAIGIVTAIVVCGWEHRPTEWGTAVHAKQLPNTDPFKARYQALSEWPAVPNAATALLFQMRHNDGGRGVYLLGQWHPHAVWYYFPVAVAVKIPETIALLALALLLVRPRALRNRLVLLAFLLLLSSLTTKLQLGVRIVFPAIAIADIGLAVAVVRGFGHKTGVAAITVMFALTTWVWPNGITYANAFVGGPAKSYRYLADSNNDWGQGIPELARWHEANGKPALATWYLTTDPRAHQPPFRRFALHEMPIENEAQLLQILGPSLLAVGISTMNQSPDETPAKLIVLAWLKRQTPIARTSTCFIYDVRFAR